jgi:hypothetical protein
MKSVGTIKKSKPIKTNNIMKTNQPTIKKLSIMETLQEYKEQARRAHYWTSFDPEKRGENIIIEFEELLNNDLKEIETASTEQKTRYIAKFKSLFSSWLNAKSNCFSAMITGPAKFNNNKHEKMNNRETSHYNAFMYWRGKAKKGILKSLQPEKTYQSEIERYKTDLEGMKKNHELMKEGNKRIQEAHRTGEDLTEYLTKTFGIVPHMIDWTMKFGFGLQNNNANMKRVEERIRIMEAKAEKSEQGDKEFSFEGGKVILNYSLDRVQIQHDTKPEYTVLSTLKHSGFHWSPSNKAWQRQITRDAISRTEQLTGISITA